MIALMIVHAGLIVDVRSIVTREFRWMGGRISEKSHAVQTAGIDAFSTGYAFLIIDTVLFIVRYYRIYAADFDT